MQIECQHIAANCNPMPHTLAFLDSTTIAYCFSNQVALYDVPGNRILGNLNHRAQEINRANCLACPDAGTIVVGYDSGHLIVYAREGQDWVVRQVVKQEHAVTYIHYDSGTFITNNTGALVVFYSQTPQGQEYIKQVDSLKFPLNKILESIVQVSLETGGKLVFMGGTDQKIYCYTRQAQGQKLTYRCQLVGHENSITKLTIAQQGDDYLLASASKDGYIRLWRITQNTQIPKLHKNVKSIDNLFIFLESVLISHECSVTSLKWVRFSGHLQLVSCSLDCTICVWGNENEDGVWSVDARMGQFLGNKNAYFSVDADDKYQYLVAVNYIGSALIWNYSQQGKKYTLRPSFNGHTNQVKDIDWNHTGDFLVSVSKDQTTRILSRNHQQNLYHQISRAQIHGYDINAVSVVKVNDGLIDLIACGADEKVIRIVQPPACFANYLNFSTKANLHLFFPSAQEEKKYTISAPGSEVLQYETYAQGGTQVLGLMTKVQRVQRQKVTAYYDDEQQQPQQQQQNQATQPKQTRINFSVPPHDDYLVKHTLWPQMNKLYGHPHQISTLARSNSRRLLASSCEGKNKQSCAIIIWSTQDWKIRKVIQHHSYTVYGMEFAEDGGWLVSVGKDRRLAIYNGEFQVVYSQEVHARAITSVSVSPDSRLVATGSRDKMFKIHSIADGKLVAEWDVKKQVHAITFCGNDALAVGCIDGSIILYSFKEGKIEQVTKIEDKYSHTKSITKLRYKNNQLASSSDDHSVRIFKLTKPQ